MSVVPASSTTLPYVDSILADGVSQTAKKSIDHETKRGELTEIKVSAPVKDEIRSSAMHSDWQLFIDPHLRE